MVLWPRSVGEIRTHCPPCRSSAQECWSRSRWIGGVPSSSRTGKVISVPPPATALTIPAAPAAATKVIASVTDIFVAGVCTNDRATQGDKTSARYVETTRRRLAFLAGSALLFLGDAEFLQLGGDIGAVGTGFDFVVDEKNFSVFADVKRPAIGKVALREHTVSFGGRFGWIAENGIIGAQRRGKRFVAFFAF